MCRDSTSPVVAAGLDREFTVRTCRIVCVSTYDLIGSD
ncbi:hypothetical protein EVA_16599 [gut metagenome]|uniref:Uncharacterized protein n=1 Tax=gut metagenome TaxID=749906 RepID=J9C623_9ZZZZ